MAQSFTSRRDFRRGIRRPRRQMSHDLCLHDWREKRDDFSPWNCLKCNSWARVKKERLPQFSQREQVIR